MLPPLILRTTGIDKIEIRGVVAIAEIDLHLGRVDVLDDAQSPDLCGVSGDARAGGRVERGRRCPPSADRGDVVA